MIVMKCTHYRITFIFLSLQCHSFYMISKGSPQRFVSCYVERSSCFVFVSASHSVHLHISAKTQFIVRAQNDDKRLLKATEALNYHQ